jgi:hypothetical protein
MEQSDKQKTHRGVKTTVCLKDKLTSPHMQTVSVLQAIMV